MLRTLGMATVMAVLLTSPGVAEDVERRLAALENRKAVEQLIIHYGRANDIIGRGHADRDAAIQASLDEYRLAFAEDATVTVYPLGSTEPLKSTDNIPDWAAFVGSYFNDQKYSSTLHLMSNFRVDFVDGDTAKATAFAINPHWIVSPGVSSPDQATRGMDLMNVRYEYEAERQANGEWRIENMTIHLDEIFAGVGFFGAGQTPSE